MNIIESGHKKHLIICHMCDCNFEYEDSDIKVTTGPTPLSNCSTTWKDWKHYLVCPVCGISIILNDPNLDNQQF